MFKFPEKYRHKDKGSDDFMAAYRMPAKCGFLQVIASLEPDWEHVSVIKMAGNHCKTPSWSEMCTVKDFFWDDEDEVIQFHPPMSEYIDVVDALHLWRPTERNELYPRF